MAIQVRERTIKEIETKLKTINTELNKIIYLESAIKESGYTFEIKRFIYGKIAQLYEIRKMFEKSAKAYANKASMEIGKKEKVETFLQAAEFYAKAGKINNAEDMFLRSTRDAAPTEKRKIHLARKNIYKISAQELERQGKSGTAVKFYEKLITMKLEDIEKAEIKTKLLQTYTRLGLFKDAKLLEKI